MKIQRSIAAITASGAVLATLLVLAAPAEAHTCTASQSPKIPVGYSSLAVGCVIDISATPSLNPGGIEVHDGLNAAWHRGAARTVTVGVTPASTTITYATGSITAGDIRRPISGPGIAGGAFIVTAGATSGTVSQKATAASAGSVTAKIEHTNARIVADVTYPLGGATTTITSATAAFTATDVNRSITGGPFAAGARISSVTNATTAVVTPGVATARAGKVLTGNGTRTLASTTVTAWTGPALLDPSDVGASVTGTGIPVGATIASVVSGTSFKLSAAATAAGTSALTITETKDVLTVGATKYTAPYPATGQSSLESSTRQLTKTSGVTCAGSVLTTTGAGGGFAATDVALPVTFLNGGVVVAGSRKVASQTATTATLSLACPATWTHVVIGKPGANAPEDAATMTRLGASLNVNPAIVPTVDDCRKNTYEGFEYLGRWQNPGSYVSAALLGAPPANSVAQIVFDTGLISFAAYVVPVATSDAAQAGPHYDVLLSSLPTSSFSVTCALSATVTTNKSAISLDFSSTTALSRTAPVASGAGNPSTATVRAIGASLGAFGPKVVLKNGGTTLATITPTACTIAAATVAPNFACGTG